MIGVIGVIGLIAVIGVIGLICVIGLIGLINDDKWKWEPESDATGTRPLGVQMLSKLRGQSESVCFSPS